MPSPVVRFFVQASVERPARRAGAGSLARQFVAALPALEARARAGLGDLPFERDEHHPHKPPAERAPEALIADLQATRADTVALARRVASEGRAGVVVEHNSLGPLTAGGWLRYLRVHADLEVRRLRRG